MTGENQKDECLLTQSLGIGIALSAYDRINMTGELDPEHRRKVARFVETHGFRRLLLFGGSRTGQAVRTCLGDRFSGFVDTASLASVDPDLADGVLITTAPLHIGQVKESLKSSPLAEKPVITLFNCERLNIRLILETQPRSGTDFTIDNLRRILHLGYASPYSFSRSECTEDGLLAYEPGANNGYIVKSHFFQPLHYPQYRFTPILFLFGYFPDTYYKWARMLAPTPDRLNYRLTPERPEWRIVRGYIPLHLQWLDYIADKTWIRFEDFHLDFQGVLATLENLLGEYPKGFSPPGSPSRRLYWSGEFSRCFDPVIQAELMDRFQAPIRRFYPEKISTP